MILTLINWLFITITSMILGYAVLNLLKRVLKTSLTSSWDVVLYVGIALLNAYAEIVSLFGGVGKNASLFLVVMTIFLAIFMFRDIKESVFRLFNKLSNHKNDKLFIILAIVCFVLLLTFLLVGCQRAYHADTDLYHAQTIRWTEEYGVIKGLGNLHHRLAYNSVFLTLQALFSWSWLINQSMHVLNAYLCMTMIIYAVTSLSWVNDKNDKKILVGSDLFRLVMIGYAAKEISLIPSPNTDNFVLLLVLYIFSKWCEYCENSEDVVEDYGFLCLLAAYAITIKLSVAMLAVLVLRPVYELIKNRKFRAISCFIFMGLLIVVPYLLRSFILSGYFVYPSEMTGFLNVDWKVPESIVKFENLEITSRARGYFEVEQFEMVNAMSFLEWLPTWWNMQTLIIKIMSVLNLIGCPCLVILSIYNSLKKRTNYDICVMLTAMVQYLYWMLSAPKSRYGIVFLFLIPGMVLALVLERFNKCSSWKYGSGLFISGVLLVALLINSVKVIEKVPIKRSSYYVYRDTREVDWNGMTVYIPIENNNTGYYGFPGATYENILQYIELREDTIEAGIRFKPEYNNIKLMDDGRVWE